MTPILQGAFPQGTGKFETAKERREHKDDMESGTNKIQASGPGQRASDRAV